MEKAPIERVWAWGRGLVALALFAAVIVEAFIVNAAEHPTDRQLGTLSFLLAAFLAWIFWLPPRPSFDRYFLAWSAITVFLAIVGAWLLLSA